MITFSETSGILDPADIRKKTQLWTFDEKRGVCAHVWTGADDKTCSEIINFKPEEPISIRSFIRDYRDPNVAQVVALNKPDNYVLEANGDWDRPLHDGTVVYMVPAVGILFASLFVELIIAMLAYAIYMIATMKFGEGASSTTKYSLSGTQNANPYGKSIEKQYGKLKRVPRYAIKPYTIYKNNQQWLYVAFSLGYGNQLFDTNDPLGFDDSSAINFHDVRYQIIRPNQSASMFDNNIMTSAEVSGGIELIASNEGKNAGQEGAWEDYGYVGPGGWQNWDSQYGENDGWTDWYNTNPIGTNAHTIYFDIEFPNGLGHIDKKGDPNTYTVSWQMQYRKTTRNPDGSITYGTPVTVTESKKKAVSQQQLRYTFNYEVPNGSYQARCRRTSIRNSFNAANGSRTSEKITWTALRARLPQKSTFGNTTVVMLEAKAQNGLTDAAAKRFYTRTTAYTQVYNRNTKVWTDTPTRNPVWAICDLIRSEYGAGYPDEYLDMDYWCDMADWCDANDITFDYVFDEETDVWSAIALVMRVMRGAPVAPLGQIRMVRDVKTDIPTAVFTKENIVDGSFQIQHKLKTYDKNGGARVEYTDEDTDETETVDCIPVGYDGTNLKSFKAYGIKNRTNAYRFGMYSFLSDTENGTAIKFDTNTKGWLCLPNDIVALNYPLFRKHTSGRILSISGNTVVLDRNVKLQDTYPNTLKICSQLDNSVLGTYIADYADDESGDYHTLTLDSAPDVTGMEFDDAQALPNFMLGIGTNIYEKCRITSKTDNESGTSFEVFIDNDKRFAYDLYDADDDLPNVLPGGAPGAPASVTVSAYDPNGDKVPTDTQISWTSAGEGLAYIVQISNDEGATWTTVRGTAVGTSILTGTYIVGSYMARVSAIYKGTAWAWGYSESTFLPPNLTRYIMSSSDNFIMVSSDGKIMAPYGG